jgi:acetyl esterase/lipase
MAQFKPDPEVAATMAQLFAAGRPETPAIGDTATRRTNVAATFSAFAPPIPTDILTKDYTITGSDGHKFPARLYSKEGAAKSQAGVLYLHGGGYIAGGGLDMYDGLICRYVEKTGIPFFAPDYRLAPEAMYPVNVDDAHKTLLYLFEHAEEFAVDPKRIAVMGDSGGGGLAAALVVSSRFSCTIHYAVEGSKC